MPHIKDAGVVAAFYNINLGLLNRRTFLRLATMRDMKDAATVAACYNRNLDYLTEGNSSISSNRGHERCCISGFYLQWKI